jgi:hypothetical protein
MLTYAHVCSRTLTYVCKQPNLQHAASVVRAPSPPRRSMRSSGNACHVRRLPPVFRCQYLYLCTSNASTFVLSSFVSFKLYILHLPAVFEARAAPPASKASAFVLSSFFSFKLQAVYITPPSGFRGQSSSTGSPAGSWRYRSC